MENKEHIYDYQAIYKNENRDKMKEYQKQYKEKNKDQVAYHYERIACECGCELRRKDMNKHKKTDKHKKLMDTI